MSLPDKAEKFLVEYETLCRKYNIMVLSDGESVELGRFEEGLWGIREETEDFCARYPDTLNELK